MYYEAVDSFLASVRNFDEKEKTGDPLALAIAAVALRSAGLNLVRQIAGRDIEVAETLDEFDMCLPGPNRDKDR